MRQKLDYISKLKKRFDKAARVSAHSQKYDVKNVFQRNIFKLHP